MVFSSLEFMFIFLSVTLYPSTTTLPLVMVSNLFKHLRKVDFPEPEGPIMQKSGDFNWKCDFLHLGFVEESGIYFVLCHDNYHELFTGEIYGK